jgi:DNA-nicking Smr family endonuclease
MHKLSAPTAKAAVRSWLESVALGQQKPRFEDDLVIIVGKGLGSEDNKPVLMPALQEYLKQEYGIAALVDENNPGRLLVKAEVLRKFASTRRW